MTSENLAKMMEEAQRMVKEMENKDFDPQKTAAERERDEAEKRTRPEKSVYSFFKLEASVHPSSHLFIFYVILLSPVLEHIKANVTKQCTENEAAAERLEGHLKDYEVKLKDLEAALKEAKDSLQKANMENNLSAQALKDMQVTDYLKLWLLVG